MIICSRIQSSFWQVVGVALIQASGEYLNTILIFHEVSEKALEFQAWSHWFNIQALTCVTTCAIIVFSVMYVQMSE